MNVILAHHAGACYGVQRALSLAREALAQNGHVTTLGSLIHNPQVVAELAANGATVADSPDDITHGPIIIRSHGVTPKIKRQVSQTGFEIIDATCPHVARAQKAAAELAEKYGCVVVVGEEGHPEVEGLRSYAEDNGGRAIVAALPEDLPSDLPVRVGVVVQTTQRKSVVEAIASALQERGICADIAKTICFATSQRQDAAAELAAVADAMVVVGGKNSSNTTRLFEICAAACPRAFHIESVSELDTDSFASCETIGLTAGASTPEEQILAVKHFLEGCR